MGRQVEGEFEGFDSRILRRFEQRQKSFRYEPERSKISVQVRRQPEYWHLTLLIRFRFIPDP